MQVQHIHRKIGFIILAQYQYVGKGCQQVLWCCQLAPLVSFPLRPHLLLGVGSGDETMLQAVLPGWFLQKSRNYTKSVHFFLSPIVNYTSSVDQKSIDSG